MSLKTEAAMMFIESRKKARIIGKAADEAHLRGLGDAYKIAREYQCEMERMRDESKPEDAEYWRGTVNTAKAIAERIRMRSIMTESEKMR